MKIISGGKGGIIKDETKARMKLKEKEIHKTNEKARKPLQPFTEEFIYKEEAESLDYGEVDTDDDKEEELDHESNEYDDSGEEKRPIILILKHHRPNKSHKKPPRLKPYPHTFQRYPKYKIMLENMGFQHNIANNYGKYKEGLYSYSVPNKEEQLKGPQDERPEPQFKYVRRPEYYSQHQVGGAIHPNQHLYNNHINHDQPPLPPTYSPYHHHHHHPYPIPHTKPHIIYPGPQGPQGPQGPGSTKPQIPPWPPVHPGPVLFAPQPHGPVHLGQHQPIYPGGLGPVPPGEHRPIPGGYGPIPPKGPGPIPHGALGLVPPGALGPLPPGAYRPVLPEANGPIPPGVLPPLHSNGAVPPELFSPILPVEHNHHYLQYNTEPPAVEIPLPEDAVTEEAHGYDFVGYFEHHSGSLGPFGFYANYKAQLD